MSSTTAIEGIVEVLQDTRILSRAHFERLSNELLPHCDDWNILGRELIYRNWLTAFQVKRLLQGRGSELVIGSYVLQEPLGEGGMGQVYRCRNWKLDTLAAVKIIRRRHAEDPAAVERFLREVRALGAMRHPHVVHALDADVEYGRLYCSMEYVPSTDLANILHHRGALSIDLACRYAAQLAEALRHISSLGLVHRDIKPANILVTEDGSMVKLLDLGLARFEHPEWQSEASNLTQVGIMIGTPDYVSPEQIRDSRRADIRSDLYSLGCTFYHMLTGQAPFGSASTIDKLVFHQTSDPRPLEELRSDIPLAVAAIVRQLMAKKPRDRYQDPTELAATLRPYLTPSGETLTDAAAPTNPGLPVSDHEWYLPRTDEIPVGHLELHSEIHEPYLQRKLGFLHRFHWLFASLIAAIGVMTFLLLLGW